MFQENSQTLERPVKKKINWLPGIDSLRFVMAVIVVIGHSRFIPDYYVSQQAGFVTKLAKLIPANMFVGIAAVMVFFIISGLVIHFPFRNGEKINVTGFYVRRLLRILIPLVALFIICAVVKIDVPNVVWSLYCEIIYYLLYPILHYALFVKKANLNTITLTSFLIAILVVALLTDDVSIAINQNAPLTPDFHSLGHHMNWLLGLPAWLLGAKIAHDFNNSFRNYKCPSYITILLFRATVLLYAVLSSILRFHFSISYKIMFIPLFMLLSYAWLKREVLFYSYHQPSKILESAGKWSYSIYLFHMLFIELFIFWFHPQTIVENLIKIALTILLCYGMYKLIEEPSHRLIKRINVK